MANKQLLSAYRKGAKALLERRGATLLEDHPEGEMTAYVLTTVAGIMKATVFDDWIACRFEHPDNAKKVVDCNPFSGKWNFHTELGYRRGLTMRYVTEALDLFENSLIKVLVPSQ